MATFIVDCKSKVFKALPCRFPSSHARECLKLWLSFLLLQYANFMSSTFNYKVTPYQKGKSTSLC